MQRVLQRTTSAERNAARKLERTVRHKEAGESWKRRQTRQQQVADLGTRIKESRKNRQIDWEAGVLAPRRDLGAHAADYGTKSIYYSALPELDPHKRPKWMHIVEGDRVVVTRGRDRGRIGEVSGTSQEQGSVTVQGVNVLDVVIPDWMNREDGVSRQQMEATPLPIPLADVKLVYPLPDPETGVPRDVIIDRVTAINRLYDKQKKEWEEGERVIAGTNTIIPWPEKADPQYEDHDDDTLRITVEETTFRPILLYSPMPPSVIDELRNRYSKFRTRHDYNYLEKKEQEDAKTEKRKELIKGMRTPLQELAELRARQKKAEERELSEEQLAKIGEVIAAERAKAMQAVSAMEPQ